MKKVIMLLSILLVGMFLVGCGTTIVDEDVPEGMTKEEYVEATG